MHEGINEDVSLVMLGSGAVRDYLMSRHGDNWGLAGRLGGVGSRRAGLPARSSPTCVIRTSRVRVLSQKAIAAQRFDSSAVYQCAPW